MTTTIKITLPVGEMTAVVDGENVWEIDSQPEFESVANQIKGGLELASQTPGVKWQYAPTVSSRYALRVIEHLPLYEMEIVDDSELEDMSGLVDILTENQLKQIRY